MRRLRILIVGAGIAGTAAASFLARRGHEVTVVEHAGATRSSGSPVDIRGGALEVVRALGAESALRARDTGARTVAFVDRLGRVITRMRLRSAPDDIEIARADLAAVLTDAANDAVAFRFGETFTALTPDDHGVEVAFATGGQERFDLVVGADGQHSATRRALWDAPGGPPTRTAPMGLAIATAPLPLVVPDPRVVEIHNEPGISLAVHPAGGRPGAAFIFRTDRAPSDRAGRLRLLRTRYGAMGWRAGEFLDALDGVPADDLYFDGVERVRADSWSLGRVVLLGDAASSLTILGEGSSMALIAARGLDRALAGEADVPAALARYERELRPRMERAQRGASAGAAFLVPKTAAGIGVRNLIARMMRA